MVQAYWLIGKEIIQQEQKGKHRDNRYVERLSQELSDVKLVVDTKNYDFPTYFLIVSDIINFAHSKKIPLDIRGSGNGSLLLYVLGVSKVDPIKYGTMWTRFLGFDDLVYLCDEDFC
jgi:DNA polymerase-3 subunit alpha